MSKRGDAIKHALDLNWRDIPASCFMMLELARIRRDLSLARECYRLLRGHGIVVRYTKTMGTRSHDRVNGKGRGGGSHRPSARPSQPA